MKRPWAVIRRYLRHDGQWSRWRVHGTYTSDAAASIGAMREIENWAKSGNICEAKVIAPGQSRKVPA